MYMGCNCNGNGPGLAGYLGEDIPWWEKLLSSGERLATSILRPGATTPTYTPPYSPYINPNLPSQYTPPEDYPAEETNILPWILIGGAVLFFMTRK